jgi:hypothetical protein
VRPPKKRQPKKKTVQYPRTIPKKKKAVKRMAKPKKPEPIDEFDLAMTGATDDTTMATEHKKEENDKDSKTDKNETRSFQTGPEGKRENLTKSEAEKRGFYWKDDPSTKDI